MDITILGTAAAEGWPALFCGCDTCRKVHEVGGKNIRSRAGVQFGQAHRFDLSPDTWFHQAHLGADLSRLEHLFISHSHGDHWTPGYLAYLKPPFAHNNIVPLHVYGNDVVTRKGNEMFAHKGDAAPAVFQEAEPLAPIQAGELTVTPVTASHMTNEHCLNYVVSSGGKTVLCAWDTGWYEVEDTWRYLESLHFDCVILECTCGPVKCEHYHMDFDHYFAFKDRLEKAGAVDAECIFIATHFSHNVGLLHEELEHVFNPHGVQVAYDGMKIIL